MAAKKKKASVTAAPTSISGGRRESSADTYRHSQQARQRPDVGVQEQFTKKKPPKTYRYDSSLDPALSWDEHRERELAEWLLGLISSAADKGEKAVFAAPQVWKGDDGVRVDSTRAAIDLLKRLTRPFLNWAGKAERHQISIPTVPLFVHERHSTKAILDGIRHRRAKGTTLDLFGDARMDIGERLDAYEHQGPWQNRMILGDSLQIMNSMLEFEGLGGQVQMIYMDPPYGVNYGSNFQPFVRKTSVKNGSDADFSREPEMVKAYRDTWNLGLHSYLTYLRDRLLLARDLLHQSGSVFVQISDENLHRVREVLDEIFGAENAISVITFKKTAYATSTLLPSVSDYLLWYAKDVTSIKFREIFFPRRNVTGETTQWTLCESPDGKELRKLTPSERRGETSIPTGWRLVRQADLTATGHSPNTSVPFEFQGRVFTPSVSGATQRHWKTLPQGLERLAAAGRLIAIGNTLAQKRYMDDFAYTTLSNFWEDTAISGFAEDRLYVVQTNPKVIERCVLMTTDPSDLVFDPTCGSGTTSYVAEQWGRRWITCDTSRVPLALARQRLLTATYPYYELKEPKLGPAGGFVYKREQNRKGEEVGGLVPHITLKSIANNERPAMEVLVDRPEEMGDVTRVSGPFVVEGTIAPAQSLEYPIEGADPSLSHGDSATHIERMTLLLRQSKTLRLSQNQSLVLDGTRRLSDVEYLHAEAVQADGKQRVAIVFGPEGGAISSDLVYNAASEAFFLKFSQLFFFGFAIQAKARELLEDRKKLRMPCTYVAVTPDVAMSDLLKTSRASEIFSVTGLPDFHVKTTGRKNESGEALYQATLEGLDVFNPATLEQESTEGQSVPAWMLDSDYDGLSFHAVQVFFPKTSAWENLQKSLKATFDDSVWAHLAGTTSEPFALGEKHRVAVKVIDERGNELLRVQELKKDGSWA